MNKKNTKRKGNQTIPRAVIMYKTVRPGPPDEMRLILRYNQSPIVTSITGIGQSYLFRGNSIFDPDLSGVGAQPAYYPELQQIYFRYRVHACRCRLIITPTTNTTTDCVLAALPTTSPMTVSVTLESLKAQNYVRKGMVMYGGVPLKLNMNIGTAEIFGLPNSVIDADDTFWGDNTTNPGRTWIYQFACQNVDLASSAAIRVNFELDYEVTLFNRISVVQ